MNESPIGVFDSGIGGLTVLKEIARLLPSENTIYLGDTARVPYGTKSKETVIRYSIEDANFLIRKGVKLIVVACNTASAFAISELQKSLKVPVIGVIEPGARKAALASKTKRIGIIGTEGTIKSNAYVNAITNLYGGGPATITEHGEKRLDRYFEIKSRDAVIFTKACPLFVSLAEEGWTDNDVARLTAEHYLIGLKKENIDTLVLGCTHYPLLKKTIASMMGRDICLIDSAETTAEEVRPILQRNNLLNDSTRRPASHSFFVTDSPERFIKVGKLFFGDKLDSTLLVRLEA